MILKGKISIITSTILVLIALALMLARPYRISGTCMEPTKKDGKLCFLNKLFPYIKQYKIDDIILFNYNYKVWISRIVALENNIIHIKNGVILVNGIPLSNNIIKRNWSDWKYGTYAINKPFAVPKSHVFVLSDNLSAHHDDSRVFGPIPNSSIIGLVW